MEIVVKKGEGVSQAIKRKLMEAGAESSDFTGSIWSEIQKSLQDEESTIEQKSGTSKIGDLWTSLTAKVKTFIGDVIKISQSTWNKIKSLVGLEEGTSETDDSKETSQADSVTDVDETEQTQETEQQQNTEQSGEYSTDSIKVNVNHVINGINENHKSGKAQAENLKKGKTSGLTKENVAYAMNHSNVMFGPNSQKQAEIVFDLLVKRLYELGLPLKDGDYGNWYCAKELSYKKQNELLHSYKKRIIEAENRIKKDSSKIQAQFDKANELLVEMANMNPKPEIKRYTKEHKAIAELPDGRYIAVKYGKDGEIDTIYISHDTTPDTGADGSTYDGTEVTYCKNNAAVDTDKSNNIYDNHIPSCYDWEALKQMAEAIFGKEPKAE